MAGCMQKQIRRIYAVGAKDLIWEMELELSWHPRDTWEVSSGSIGGKKTPRHVGDQLQLVDHHMRFVGRR